MSGRVRAAPRGLPDLPDNEHPGPGRQPIPAELLENLVDQVRLQHAAVEAKEFLEGHQGGDPLQVPSGLGLPDPSLLDLFQKNFVHRGGF